MTKYRINNKYIISNYKQGRTYKQVTSSMKHTLYVSPFVYNEMVECCKRGERITLPFNNDTHIKIRMLKTRH